MESENNITCPKCKSITCVLGKLEPSDSDTQFNGCFYPLHIKQKSFFKIFSTCVKFEHNNDFYACYTCGHFWGEIKVNNLQKVLEKLEWRGELQIPPNKPRPILEWFLSAVIGALVIWIIYLNIMTL